MREPPSELRGTEIFTKFSDDGSSSDHRESFRTFSHAVEPATTGGLLVGWPVFSRSVSSVGCEEARQCVSSKLTPILYLACLYLPSLALPNNLIPRQGPDLAQRRRH